VDEYQDTNYIQLKLVKLLAGKSMNLCVVGDDDQSIYGWRGADIKNILDFTKHFSGARKFTLEHNYRSTNTILGAANAVISRNSNRAGKNLWSDLGDGEAISFSLLEDENNEADFVAQKIKDMIFSNGDSVCDEIVVLYRSNYQSRLFENALRNSQIPYRIVGAKSFYERREIKDAIAYLKLIVNPKDDPSFTRAVASPPRGIGDKSLEYIRREKMKSGSCISEIISEQKLPSSICHKSRAALEQFNSLINKWRQNFSNSENIAAIVEEYLNDTGMLEGLLRIYKDQDEAIRRQENVMELINAIAFFEKKGDGEKRLRDFLELYSLYDDSDKIKDDSSGHPAVRLMTVHAAKGLEFDYVFIVGCEHGMFPHERALMEKNEDEERRLFYVALTRAKKEVFISSARQRFKHGQSSEQRPSIFLLDIPEELIKKTLFFNNTPRYRRDNYFGAHRNRSKIKKQTSIVFND
jgi:superfamily I DNA/RNA helicase